jgi:peptide deformylase
MTILPILIHPHPVLRQKAEKVGDITPEILKLLDDMLETMYAAPGIGLAAPQIGVSKRIVVMDVAGEDVGKKRNPMKLINPEIIAVSETKTILDEGCLSLPEMRVEVSRPEIVTVRYKDEKGTEYTIEATDLLAKCFQHEIDHLDGKLIFDYLSPLKRDMALRKYNKNLKLAGE